MPRSTRPNARGPDRPLSSIPVVFGDVLTTASPATGDGDDVIATREPADTERAVATGGGTTRRRAAVSEVAARRDPGERPAARRRLGGAG